ncbi:flagellar hook-length control protein FliK [Chromatiaceae bacterium AAb-1]|nr:flagellar hook-length control protein FliK [Chromatiaceae bacterium AAb-1]
MTDSLSFSLLLTGNGATVAEKAMMSPVAGEAQDIGDLTEDSQFSQMLNGLSGSENKRKNPAALLSAMQQSLNPKSKAGQLPQADEMLPEADSELAQQLLGLISQAGQTDVHWQFRNTTEQDTDSESELADTALTDSPELTEAVLNGELLAGNQPETLIATEVPDDTDGQAGLTDNAEQVATGQQAAKNTSAVDNLITDIDADTAKPPVAIAAAGSPEQDMAEAVTGKTEQAVTEKSAAVIAQDDNAEPGPAAAVAASSQAKTAGLKPQAQTADADETPAKSARKAGHATAAGSIDSAVKSTADSQGKTDSDSNSQQNMASLTKAAEPVPPSNNLRPENSFAGTLSAAQSQLQTNSTVATEPPKNLAEQLKQSLNLLQQDAAGQLRERVNLMVRQNIQIAEIRLDPAELGQMQIKINMQQDQASVQFIVQQPQAKELLEQQLPKLRELLQQQGIQLAEGQVQQQQQHQQQAQGNRGFSSGQGDMKGTEEELSTPVQLDVKLTDRLVDYYA